jgi:hypothetical protein
MLTQAMSMWTVYDSPSDMPGHFVARRFEITRHGSQPTDEYMSGQNLDMLRDLLTTLHPGLVCIPRSEQDEPHIVEVWL